MASFSFIVEDKDITFLKSQWDSLASFYIADQTIKEDIFQILKEKYSEEGRFYHNLSHIKALLNLFEAFKAKIQDNNAVRFAIWFHDVVYNAKRSDNEEQSAIWASEILSKLQVSTETTKIVRALILATKNHGGINLSGDAKLFLDMDLAILGASEGIYKEYNKAIRQEYSWVAESAYHKGRKKVLKSFIEQERIYFTDEMQIGYEKQARINIQGEIKSLNAQE